MMLNTSVMRVLVAVLLIAAVVPSFARRGGHPSKYAQTGDEERAAGLARLSQWDPRLPQQVFTALDGRPDTFTISWLTTADNNDIGVVEYGPVSRNYSTLVKAALTTFVDPQRKLITRYIYVATVNVQPSGVIYYRVGFIKGFWSPEYKFRAPRPSNERVVMAVYGDLGVVNAVSVQAVLADVNAEKVDMILHNGDYAYDLHTEDGTWGDVFMNEIMPLSTQVAYMGVQGNHEGKYNASHYTQRFTSYKSLGVASGSGSNNWWFSWEYKSGGALIHMVAIDTEVYYVYEDEFTPPDLTPQRVAQYKWLDADLKSARQRADWVIVYGHRPLFCSNNDGDDCTIDAPVLRDGINGTEYGMEKLFLEHKIDIYIAAHEHSYERTVPIAKGKGDLSQSNHTYINPTAPVYIIAGSAGCQEGFDGFANYKQNDWSVIRSDTYGYAHMTIHNATHLHWRQFLNEGFDGTDELWIIQTNKRISAQVETQTVLTMSQ